MLTCCPIYLWHGEIGEHMWTCCYPTWWYRWLFWQATLIILIATLVILMIIMLVTIFLLDYLTISSLWRKCLCSSHSNTSAVLSSSWSSFEVFNDFGQCLRAFGCTMEQARRNENHWNPVRSTHQYSPILLYTVYYCCGYPWYILPHFNSQYAFIICRGLQNHI